MGGLNCVNLQSEHSEAPRCTIKITREQRAFNKLNEIIKDEVEHPAKEIRVKKFVKQHHLTPEIYFRYVECPLHTADYPPIVAILSGNLDMLKLLQSLGFRFPDQEVTRIDPVLVSLCKEGKWEICKSLVTNFNVDLNEGSKVTPLLLAAEKDDCGLVRFFVENGASVNATVNGRSILHTFMVENGPSVDAAGTRFCNPRTCSQDIYEYLISSGANVNDRAEDVMGLTPLITAVSNQDEYTTYLLVKYGADMTLKDALEQTAFTWAFGKYISLFKSYKHFHRSEMEIANWYRLTTFLLCAGYVPSEEERSESYDVCVEANEQNLRELLKQPSLQELCVFRTRQNLGTRLPKGVDCLPILSKFKDFLKLEHIVFTSDHRCDCKPMQKRE